MRKTKNYLLLGLLSCSSLSFAQYTDQINSNRPGESMSAYSVGETVFQVEAGLYGIREKHNVLDYDANGLGADLQVRYGAFFEELELIADLQYQYDWYTDALNTTNRNDFKQSTIGAKYMVYDPWKNYKPEVNVYSWKATHKFSWRKLIPAIAVYVGGNFVTNNNPYTFRDDKFSPKVMLITHSFYGKWVWVNNIIADKVTTEYPNYGLISTLTRGFSPSWSGFFEAQVYTGDFYSDAIFRAGAAYLLNDSMQLDASISKNIKETPSILYGGVGFSWRFDLNYKDILLPGESDLEKSESEAQTKKRKQDEKDKKEQKERLDEVAPE